MLGSALACAAFLAAAPAAASPRKSMPVSPASELGSRARFEPPRGWTREDSRVLGDPVASFRSGSDVIRVQLLGGPKSRYRTVEEFLAGPEAQGTDGAAALVARRRAVAGRQVELRLRRLRAPAGGPGADVTLEEFCLVAAGSRYFVLSHSVSSPDAPDLGARLPDWDAFLSSFRLSSARK
jgi:hypothetical protein